MPYDDTNIKKMIRYQTERKVAFSRSKHLSQPCKDVIHRMLEADIKRRAVVTEIRRAPWLQDAARMLPVPTPTSRRTTSPATHKTLRDDEGSRSTTRSSYQYDGRRMPMEDESGRLTPSADGRRRDSVDKGKTSVDEQPKALDAN